MYVDESGDGGTKPGCSQHYILSGLIINYKDWPGYLDRLKAMRGYFKKEYSLNINTEFHCSEIFRVSKMPEYNKIHKSARVKMLTEYASFIKKMFKKARVINVCIDKSQHPRVKNFQELAWSRLVTRYNRYLKKTAEDFGIIIADESGENIVRKLTRKTRRYNPFTSQFDKKPYNDPTIFILEDVSHRKSKHSYFLQTVDLIAYLLYNMEYPKGSRKKYHIDRLFNDLKPILLLEASPKDKLGIVRK